jgi:hypothetical protein
MYVEDEVGRKTSTVDVADWEDAYMEIKDLLENRFFFEEVEEERFRHHKDKGLIVSKINAIEEEDKFTEIELTFVVTIDILEEGSPRATVTIDSKAEVITEYPEHSAWQRSPLYYALRSIWDKLVYVWARGKYTDEGEELLVDVHSAIRGAFTSASIQR